MDPIITKMLEGVPYNGMGTTLERNALIGVIRGLISQDRYTVDFILSYCESVGYQRKMAEEVFEELTGLSPKLIVNNNEYYNMPAFVPNMCIAWGMSKSNKEKAFYIVPFEYGFAVMEKDEVNAPVPTVISATIPEAFEELKKVAKNIQTLDKIITKKLLETETIPTDAANPHQVNLPYAASPLQVLKKNFKDKVLSGAEFERQAHQLLASEKITVDEAEDLMNWKEELIDEDESYANDTLQLNENWKPLEAEDEDLDSFEYTYSLLVNGNITEYKEALNKMTKKELVDYIDWANEMGIGREKLNLHYITASKKQASKKVKSSFNDEEKPCKFIITAYEWGKDYDPFVEEDNGSDGEFYGYFARHPDDPENNNFSYYVDDIKDARRFETIDEAERIIERFEDGSELNYHIEKVYDDTKSDVVIEEGKKVKSELSADVKSEMEQEAQEIISNFDPKAIKVEIDTNGGSVLIADNNSDFQAWVDVWIDGNDVDCDWNQYITYINDPKEYRDLQVRNDTETVFDLATSEAVQALKEKGVIVQEDDASWHINKKSASKKKASKKVTAENMDLDDIEAEDNKDQVQDEIEKIEEKPIDEILSENTPEEYFENALSEDKVDTINDVVSRCIDKFSEKFKDFDKYKVQILSYNTKVLGDYEPVQEEMVEDKEINANAILQVILSITNNADENTVKKALAVFSVTNGELHWAGTIRGENDKVVAFTEEGLDSLFELEEPSEEELEDIV